MHTLLSNDAARVEFRTNSLRRRMHCAPSSVPPEKQQDSVAVQWGGTITRTEEDHPRLCLGNPVHAHPETARSIPALHVPMLQTGAFSPRHSNWRVCILRDLPFQVHPLLERPLTAFTLRTR